MRKADRIASTLILLFSVYVFIGSFGFNYMNDKVPGPGFFPFWVGLLMAVISLAMLVNSLRGKVADEPSPFKREDLKEMAVVIGGSIGAVLLSNVTGLVVALGLMTGFIAKFLGTKSWRLLIALTVGTPLTLYVIFVLILGVPVPGFLEL